MDLFQPLLLAILISFKKSSSNNLPFSMDEREVLTSSSSRNVFSLSGAPWRRHRHVINPTFSAAKLKLMSPLINGCISNVMEKLADHVKNDNEFNIYLYYKRMTMDVICKYTLLSSFSSRQSQIFQLENILNCSHFWHSLGRCAFGLDTDLQNNPDNIYFKKVEAIFVRNFRLSSVFKLAQLVPEAAKIIGQTFSAISKGRALINMHVLPLISKRQLDELLGAWLFNRLHPIIEQRQQTSTSRVDVLQLMLQVMTEETINVS